MLHRSLTVQLETSKLPVSKLQVEQLQAYSKKVSQGQQVKNQLTKNISATSLCEWPLLPQALAGPTAKHLGPQLTSLGALDSELESRSLMQPVFSQRRLGLDMTSAGVLCAP